MFRIYDDDDNGFIEFDNLRNVADALAEEAEQGPTTPIDDEDVRNMILIADRKGKGVVDMEDFLFVMESAGLFDAEYEAELKRNQGMIGKSDTKLLDQAPELAQSGVSKNADLDPAKQWNQPSENKIVDPDKEWAVYAAMDGKVAEAKTKADQLL